MIVFGWKGLLNLAVRAGYVEKRLNTTATVIQVREQEYPTIASFTCNREKPLPNMGVTIRRKHGSKSPKIRE